MLSDRTVNRLYKLAQANRWRVDVGAFGRTLEASAAKAFDGQPPDGSAVERYLAGLRLDDLALACACAAGDEEAWRHFVLTYRPQLYRAADVIDPTGGSRDLADSLYGDLFGLGGADGERQSLFRYFHGRSSLATWLRAVMSQRYIDRLRAARKVEPLPDEESAGALAAPPASADPQRSRFLELMHAALAAALALLGAQDRLRLGCYYAQQMTLAQTGRLLGEHEATVSRQLARTRRALRTAVEQHLSTEASLDEAAIEECFRSIVDDTGPLDLQELLGAVSAGTEAARPLDARETDSGLGARKEVGLDRSTEGSAS